MGWSEPYEGIEPDTVPATADGAALMDHALEAYVPSRLLERCGQGQQHASGRCGEQFLTRTEPEPEADRPIRER